MAPRVVFIRHPGPWDFEFKSWGGIVGQHMNKIVNTTHVQSRREAPRPRGVPLNRTGINYSTGNLSNNIISERTHAPRTGDLEGRVIALPKHAIYVHKGTPPHVIRARRPGGRLVFFWHKVGRVVKPQKVNHPGTMANPFLERALRRAMNLFR